MKNSGMEIKRMEVKDFKKCKNKIKGVIHIGANVGQELNFYENNGVKEVIWIEPIEEVYKILEENVKTSKMINYTYNLLISDKDDELITFYRYKGNNKAPGGLSSIYELNSTHTRWTDGPKANKKKDKIILIEKKKLKTIRLDTFIKNNNIDLSNYEFLNIDTQGSELKVLKSMGNNIKNIKYINTEISHDGYNIYNESVQYTEINNYLNSQNFYHDNIDSPKNLENLEHRTILYKNKLFNSI